jgi:hypothetical protein
MKSVLLALAVVDISLTFLKIDYWLTALPGDAELLLEVPPVTKCSKTE